ncbi:ATP-binding protein [Flammeovirgaceae bacterium SG7u.111]|nr:ATP-binding protein [Flammeovirgaceae bacterium SG7u.132]WPO34640.1 ATP-binding protein [Flammeovirgaceae bacterium SG7u.111]
MKSNLFLKKSSLLTTAVLLGFALVGLIVLQFYWLNVSVEVNNERFAHDVRSAMGDVVLKLEKEEAIFLAKQQFANSVNVVDDYFLMDFDSMGNARWEEGKTIKFTQTIESEEMAAAGFSYEVEEEARISKSGYARKKFSSISSEGTKALGSSPMVLNDKVDSARWYKRISQQSRAKLSKMTDMVSDIVVELIRKSKDFDSRVDKERLDSLLTEALHDRGLDIEYDFAVVDGSQGLETVVMTDAPGAGQTIKKLGFKATLFPSDLFGNQHLLYVYFPDQQSFIIRKMWLVLASSTVFISLIIYGFAFAVFTIMRQKKISEITNDFISNMTHELKTPISTVSLATEALLDPDIRALPNQSERYLGIIKDENNRLALQVEKVLQTARMDRGDFKLKKMQMNIHEAVDKAIKNIAIQIEKKDGTLESVLDATQPVIEADSLHVTNIIYNLLDNANKYSPEKPEITIRTVDSSNGIKLFVSDKGQGISKDMLNKIFDKFYRVPTGNVHNVKGFGLGLSYVKTMVEAHGGSISVRSELNKGSVFTIFLPYHHE